MMSLICNRTTLYTFLITGVGYSLSIIELGEVHHWYRSILEHSVRYYKLGMVELQVCARFSPSVGNLTSRQINGLWLASMVVIGDGCPNLWEGIFSLRDLNNSFLGARALITLGTKSMFKILSSAYLASALFLIWLPFLFGGHGFQLVVCFP